jgi:hypothetical protein
LIFYQQAAREYAFRFINNIIQKLVLLDDVNKDVFQRLLIAKGIKWILDSQKNGLDFIRFASSDTPYLAIVFLPLITFIEEIVRTNGEGLTTSRFNNLFASPRELIRLFHRRRVCGCLKNLYYNLKDNTAKRTICHGCYEIRDAKNIFQCDYCKITFYCSRECAKRDWARHQIMCTAYKRYNELTAEK